MQISFSIVKIHTNIDDELHSAVKMGRKIGLEGDISTSSIIYLDEFNLFML